MPTKWLPYSSQDKTLKIIHDMLLILLLYFLTYTEYNQYDDLYSPDPDVRYNCVKSFISYQQTNKLLTLAILTTIEQDGNPDVNNSKTVIIGRRLYGHIYDFCQFLLDNDITLGMYKEYEFRQSINEGP